MKRLLPSSILLFATLMLTGCDPVQMYQPVTGGYLGARITPQSSWSARGSLSTPQNAVDGNFATTARAGGQGGGEIEPGFQGRRDKTVDYNTRLPFDPATINVMLLSHAHIDHTGLIPVLCRALNGVGTSS